MTSVIHCFQISTKLKILQKEKGGREKGKNEEAWGREKEREREEGRRKEKEKERGRKGKKEERKEKGGGGGISML